MFHREFLQVAYCNFDEEKLCAPKIKESRQQPTQLNRALIISLNISYFTISLIYKPFGYSSYEGDTLPYTQAEQKETIHIAVLYRYVAIYTDFKNDVFSYEFANEYGCLVQIITIDLVRTDAEVVRWDITSQNSNEKKTCFVQHDILRNSLGIFLCKLVSIEPVIKLLCITPLVSFQF